MLGRKSLDLRDDCCMSVTISMGNWSSNFCLREAIQEK